MRRPALVLTSALILLSGCSSIVGRWEATSIAPEAVSDFTLASATFMEDGTYVASGSYNGHENTSTGSYDYASNQLTLYPDSGRGERTYIAKRGMFNTLSVSYPRADQADVTVTMKKVDCCASQCASSCAKGCCAKQCASGCKKACCAKQCAAGCTKDCCAKKCAAGCTKPCCQPG